MTYCDQGLLLASVGSNPMILCLEILILRSRCAVRCLNQGVPQPTATLARFAIASLARRLGVTRAHTRPGSKVFIGRKAAHVPTYFRQHHFGNLTTDARELGEPLYRQFKRAEPLYLLQTEALECLRQ